MAALRPPRIRGPTPGSAPARFRPRLSSSSHPSGRTPPLGCLPRQEGSAPPRAPPRLRSPPAPPPPRPRGASCRRRPRGSSAPPQSARGSRPQLGIDTWSLALGRPLRGGLPPNGNRLPCAEAWGNGWGTWRRGAGGATTLLGRRGAQRPASLGLGSPTPRSQLLVS